MQTRPRRAHPCAATPTPADLGRQQLTLLLDHVPGVLWNVDRDLCFTSSAGEGLRRLRLADGECVGMHLTTFLGTDDPDDPVIAMHRRALSGESCSYETVMGGRVWQCRLEPLRSAGAIVGVTGLGIDQTEQRRALDRVRASEERFRLLAEHSDALVYLLRLRPSPHFEYVNGRAAAITGFPAEDYVLDAGLPLQRVHPDDAWQLTAIRAPAEVAGEARLRFQRADGAWIWLEDHYTPLRDASGDIVAIQGLIFDVSAREEATRRLSDALLREQEAGRRQQALNLMQRSFLQATSHELRTPLTTVLGIALTLRRRLDSLPRADVDRLLAGLVDGSERLRHLLDDLLIVDHLGTGDLPCDPTPFHLDDLVRRVAANVDLAGRSLSVEASPTPVTADVQQVRRMIEILLGNTAKHTPDGTHVTIAVSPTGDGPLLTVEDDGPGVPDELKRAVFAPFRQGPDSLGLASPGTGVGLTLVAGFARLHAGRAWVEDRPGGGARFRVLLGAQRVMPSTPTPAMSATTPAKSTEEVTIGMP